MGKADIETKNYVKDPNVFADIFNYFLYGGKRVIFPEQLKELDPTIVHKFFDEKGKPDSIQTMRDTYKLLSAMSVGDVAYIILGIEGQSTIDYTMPVRCMSYDATEYSNQVDKIQNEHMEKKDYSGHSKDEFFSKFFKEDYLIPVMTVVINLSSKPWDDPKSLHEMFRIKDPDVLSLIGDYRLNLIDPHTMDQKEMDKFETNVREVLIFIKNQKDKKKLREIMTQDARFKHLSRNARRMIETCVHWEFKEDDEEKEDVDMCQALLEIQADAREEGREEGRKVALIFLIRKKHEKKNSSEEIGEMLELNIKYVDNIIHLMEEHPDWDDKQVYKALNC